MSQIDHHDERGAYSVAGFCHAYGVGTTFLYAEIKAGRLRAVKAGGRTLVLRRDAEEWVRSLPEMRAAS